MQWKNRLFFPVQSVAKSIALHFQSIGKYFRNTFCISWTLRGNENWNTKNVSIGWLYKFWACYLIDLQISLLNLFKATNKESRMTSFDINLVYLLTLRPLAFENSFSPNRRIYDFVCDIAAFCLDIKQEFFIFHFSMFHIKVWVL